MPAYSKYADCFTTLWALMTYSAGMPILYPIAVISFVLMFLFNKIFIVKHYSKSIMFDSNM